MKCEDVDAAYHRKHVQPPFNERNSALVWQQSLQQAEDMLSLWTASPVVEKSRIDFRRLALHILSSAAFGVNLSFLPKVGVDQNSIFTDGEPKEGYTRSWRHTLEYMAGSLVEIIAAKSILPEWAMPDMMSVLRDMRCYIDTLIDGADMKAGVNGNLLSAIASTGKGYMKYEHIMGNVFMLSVAGQETMSNTMQYAFIMLALNPEAQEWFARRLEEQLKDLPENWTYEEAYNRLSAPRCLMVRETVPMMSESS
jgi:cytochrome P450